ncbi:hypothetical protein DIPPA_09036 [Diplonema papillatum]|nr:hypothetical protein DIPPA_09036 [Diplonema papillatum]
MTMLSSKSANSSGLAFVSPERRRTRGAMELHPLATGCVVYVIRQTCHLVAPDERATSEELGDAVPTVFRPTEGALGVLTQQAQFLEFVDRAADDPRDGAKACLRRIASRHHRGG